MSDEKMIFKAKDLIKKEQVFQVEGDTYTNLKLACEKVAYSAFLKRNIQMSTNLNRLVRLTNRLEREFLRGEEDRVLTIIFDTDGFHPKNILHVEGAIRSSNNLDFLMYQLGFWSSPSSKSIFTECFHKNSKHKCVIKWDEWFNDFSLIALEPLEVEGD